MIAAVGVVAAGSSDQYSTTPRAVFSNYDDDDEETVLETPGHAYCLREAQ